MFRSIASIAVAGLLLVGCGAGISKDAMEAVGYSDAPSWAFEDNGKYTAVGFAPIFDNDLDLAKTEAINNASRDLANEIQKKVISIYSHNKGRTEQDKSTNIEDKLKTMASQVLNGVHVKKFWFNEKKVAVLVEMQEGFVRELRKELKNMGIDYNAVEQSMRNVQTPDQTAQQPTSQASTTQSAKPAEEEW